MPTKLFKKGEPRPEGAGRKKGSVNKSIIAVRDYCEAVGCRPFEFMALVVVDQVPRVKGREPFIITLDHRIACARELAKYLAPQMRSIEVSGTLKVTQTPAEELAQKAIEMVKNDENFAQIPS